MNEEKIKSELIKDIKQLIENNGYVKIGHIFSKKNEKYKEFFSIPENDPFSSTRPFYIMKSVAHKIIEDGKYIFDFDPNKKDFDIKKNPNYELSESVRKTNIATIINIAATIILGLIVTGLSIRSCARELNKEIDQARQDSILQDRQLRQEQNEIKLQEELHRISQSLSDTSKVKVKIEK